MARDFAGEDDAALILRLDRVTHWGHITEVGSDGQVVAAVGWGDVNIVEHSPREHEGIPNICRDGGQSVGTGEDPVDGDLLGRRQGLGGGGAEEECQNERGHSVSHCNCFCCCWKVGE